MRLKIVIFLLLFIKTVGADEFFKFVNVVCLEKAGFFEVFDTGILNIEAYSKDHEIVKEIEAKSNLVYGRGTVSKSCQLEGGLFEVIIEYAKASERGMCMGNPGASLTLKKNGITLVENAPFGWRCSGADINRLTVNSGTFVNMCGINYGLASYKKNAFCISDFKFPSGGSPVTRMFIEDFAKEEYEKMKASQ